jgi:hypothetical protein
MFSFHPTDFPPGVGGSRRGQVQCGQQERGDGGPPGGADGHQRDVPRRAAGAGYQASKGGACRLERSEAGGLLQGGMGCLGLAYRVADHRIELQNECERALRGGMRRTSERVDW